MKNRKRFLALVSAAAMVLAPCTAFATDTVTSPAIGNANSTGTVEGWVDKEVFTVVLPTVASNSLDFILDPQGLIADTLAASGSHYYGKTFEASKTLYFNRVDTGKSNDYESRSDDITITNKSSIPVEITVEATTTGDAVSLTTDSAFTDSTKTEVYLALSTGGSTDVYVDPSTSKATLTSQLDAVDASNFEVTYTNGAYSYGLKAGLSDTVFPKFTFYLTGACNSAANWGDTADIAPGVDLVWTVKGVYAESLPTVSSADDVLDWADRENPYSLKVDLAALGATEVTDFGVSYNKKIYDYTGTWGGSSALKTVGLATLEDTTITLNPKLSTYLPSGNKLYIKYTTTGGEVKTLAVTVN
jgi:hypothetical protein